MSWGNPRRILMTSLFNHVPQANVIVSTQLRLHWRLLQRTDSGERSRIVTQHVWFLTWCTNTALLPSIVGISQRCFLIFNHPIFGFWSRGSSVSTVSGYGLDDLAIEVRSPAEAKDFSSSLCIQTGSGAHPASCTMGTGGPFPGGKARPWRDADHSTSSTAEVMNE
jgi:hypothetical protein